MKQKLETELSGLRKRMNEIHEALDEIRLAEMKPKMERMIGKCFYYLNSFGGDEKWKMYSKIIGIKDDSFQLIVFQSDSMGTIEMKRESAISPNQLDYHLFQVEITNETYMKEYNKVLKALKVG